MKIAYNYIKFYVRFVNPVFLFTAASTNSAFAKAGFTSSSLCLPLIYCLFCIKFQSQKHEDDNYVC